MLVTCGKLGIETFTFKGKSPTWQYNGSEHGLERVSLNSNPSSNISLAMGFWTRYRTSWLFEVFNELTHIKPGTRQIMLVFVINKRSQKIWKDSWSVRKDELALEKCQVWNDGCSNWITVRDEGLKFSGETSARHLCLRVTHREVTWSVGRKESRRLGTAVLNTTLS